MKIRTAAEVTALDEKIQRELGVDIGKYRNEEVVSQFGELIVFPVYVVQWVLRPTAIALLTFVLSFFVLELVHVEYLIYGLLGLMLWLTGGLLAGILLLTYRFRADLSSLLEYSTVILRDIVLDVDRLNLSRDRENRVDRLKLLYRGVLHIITIPVAGDVIGNKLPIVGGLLARVVIYVLRLVANARYSPKADEFSPTGTDDDSGKILPLYATSVNRLNVAIQRALEVAVQVVQFPFKIGLFVIAGFLMLLIYLVN